MLTSKEALEAMGLKSGANSVELMSFFNSFLRMGDWISNKSFKYRRMCSISASLRETSEGLTFLRKMPVLFLFLGISMPSSKINSSALATLPKRVFM